jgi:hypothetical protein
MVRWRETVDHSGNALAACSGVTPRDLMARIGHDSMQAAIICRHPTTEADARIAAALDAELSAGDDDQAADETGPDDQPGRHHGTARIGFCCRRHEGCCGVATKKGEWRRIRAW